MFAYSDLFDQLNEYAPSNPGGVTQMNGSAMDVLGSLKANSDFATQFQRNPMSGAGPVSGPAMVSDANLKHKYVRLDQFKADDDWMFGC